MLKPFKTSITFKNFNNNTGPFPYPVDLCHKVGLWKADCLLSVYAWKTKAMQAMDLMLKIINSLGFIDLLNWLFGPCSDQSLLQLDLKLYLIQIA